MARREVVVDPDLDPPGAADQEAGADHECLAGMQAAAMLGDGLAQCTVEWLA